MALTDIQIKVASEEAVFGLQRHMAPLGVLAHNFSPEAGTKFAGVGLPVYDLSAAAEFDAETNNWGNASDIDGAVVTLDKEFIKCCALPDKIASTSDVNFLRDGAKAIVDVLGHAANKYVFGLLQTVTTSADVDLSSKQAFADLFAVADANGVNPYESTLVLGSTAFAACLGTHDSAVYGGNEAVQRGLIPGLYGYRAVVSVPQSYLPSGDVGAIIPYGCLGVVSRVDEPAVDGYVATFTAEDANGLAVGLRVFEDLNRGKGIIGGSLLMGAKILKNGIIRLV